jgi:hypothetical protein
MTDQTNSSEPSTPSTSSDDNLRDVLMAIRAKRGTLTPEVVVEEAADPHHPLHHRFEWNDTEAAVRYRLLQAQQLLRVKYKTDVGNKRGDLRAFWVQRDASGASTGAYEPIEEIILDPMQRELMLRQMRRDWQTFKRRYQHMAEFTVEVLSDLDSNKAG